MRMPTRLRRVRPIAAAPSTKRVPHHEVGARPVEDRLEHLRDLARIVLAVAVDLDRELEAVRPSAYW